MWWHKYVYGALLKAIAIARHARSLFPLQRQPNAFHNVLYCVFEWLGWVDHDAVNLENFQHTTSPLHSRQCLSIECAMIPTILHLLSCVVTMWILELQLFPKVCDITIRGKRHLSVNGQHTLLLNTVEHLYA